MAPLILRPSDSEWIIPPAFLILQFEDGRLWDFLTSTTSWANFYNKSPLIHIYIHPIGSVSLEDSNTGLFHFTIASPMSFLTCKEPVSQNEHGAEEWVKWPSVLCALKSEMTDPLKMSCLMGIKPFFSLCSEFFLWFYLFCVLTTRHPNLLSFSLILNLGLVVIALISSHRASVSSI